MQFIHYGSNLVGLTMDPYICCFCNIYLPRYEALQLEYLVLYEKIRQMASKAMGNAHCTRRWEYP